MRLEGNCLGRYGLCLWGAQPSGRLSSCPRNFYLFDAFDRLSLQPVSEGVMIYAAGQNSEGGMCPSRAWELSAHTSSSELKVLQGVCVKMEQLQPVLAGG